MPVAKILLAGRPGVGKTETIRAISHFPAQVVKKRVPATQAVLELDYGRVFVAPDMVYLYASARTGKLSGADWAGLMAEMDGLVYVVDASSTLSGPDLDYCAELERLHSLPLTIALNGVARPSYNQALYQEFRVAFPESVKIVLYDAVDRDSSIRLAATAAGRVRLERQI